MGADAIKRDLREKIISYQYGTDTADIWELLDTYDRQLELEHTQDEMAEAAFFRGRASFRGGRYYDTVKAFTKSLGIQKTREYAYLETESYNMFGMLFSFVGYETVALENYLAALDSSKKNEDTQEQVVILLNIGILYQSLSDYRKAMAYYKKGQELVNLDYAKPDIRMLLLCLIQQARLLCQMNQHAKALHMKQDIDSYYHASMQGEFLLPKWLLDITLEEYCGSDKHRKKLIEEVRDVLDHDEEYLEQIDFYMELCGYLIEKNEQEQSRDFLNILKDKLRTTEFLYLRMRVEELEVAYQKKYSDEEQYENTCMHYMEVQQEYEQTLKGFKQRNLTSIESLQEIENQRKEFEVRSQRDLATGLLNKDTFQYEVERYLEERNRDICDALIMIDIDDFKLVNDRFGHLVGDEVIVRLADLIRMQFEKNCICARFGGDEFVILIREIEDIYQMEKQVEQFRATFSQIGFGQKKHIHNTVSIGVSYNRDINASYKTMISCADEALLKSKEYGKNRVAFYEIKRGLLKYV